MDDGIVRLLAVFGYLVVRRVDGTSFCGSGEDGVAVPCIDGIGVGGSGKEDGGLIDVVSVQLPAVFG